MKETTANPENEQRRQIKAWWKKHWKKVVGGVIVVAGTALIVKNWTEILELFNLPADALPIEPVDISSAAQEISANSAIELTAETIRKAPEVPFDVCAHVRNLPEGWHASPEKLAEAAALNIILLPNQTLVDSYVKCKQVA